MAGILQVFQAFQTQLAVYQAGVSTHLGAPSKFYEEAPPRVVWWPTSESYQPAESQGDPVAGIGNPRRTWIRRCQMEIHVWAANRDATGAEPFEGADLQATEQLLDTTMQALWDAALTFGSFREVSGEWLPLNAEQMRFGYVYVLRATILIPVTRPVETTAPMTTAPTTVQIKDPVTGVLETAAVIQVHS